MRGSNLPAFRSVQLDFAAHIRNPEIHPRPADVEPRRMQIYLDLFFNNIKSFLDSTFPVSRKVLGEQQWRALAREFVHQHGSQSPYFLQICEEFLRFLSERGLDDLPPFLLELAHYEWVELALDVADADLPEAAGAGDPLGDYTVSPLMRALIYDFPVHKIGIDFQPLEVPANPTFLIVYRTRELKVRFMESNPVTHRLVDLLNHMPAAAALAQIGTELAAGGRNVSTDSMHQQGIQTLTHLAELGIIMQA